MKLYSVWQPLDDEDQRTAMVFGFLRHAPVEHGLAAWLRDILGRQVTAGALDSADFWPSYTSHMPGCTWTSPELVFSIQDERGPLHVVIEAKSSPGMHYEEQLVREAVDVAHEEPAPRLALIAVGADLGVPTALPAWQAAIDAGLAQHGPPGATATAHYSSWAQLGDTIERIADAVPTLATYAEDVLAKMHQNGMLGYKGAPVHDDLEGGLTIVNAFEVVNRAALAARQFFRTLHDSQPFRASGLSSYWGSFEMRRNGTSKSLNQDQEWFQISMFMSAYRKTGWPEGAGAFAAFYFASGDDEPQLQVGVFKTSWDNLLVEYDYSDTAEEVADEHLAAYAGPDLPNKAAAANSEWLYDERPWLAGQQDADITWAVQRLEAAATVFESPA